MPSSLLDTLIGVGVLLAFFWLIISMVRRKKKGFRDWMDNLLSDGNKKIPISLERKEQIYTENRSML